MANPDSSRAASSRLSMLRCLVISIVTVIVVFGLIILIIWLIVRPASIDYSIEKAQMRDYNLSSSNLLNATFDITIQSNNHNKKVSLYYDYMKVSVWYADQLVASSDVLPFSQPRRNITRLDVRAIAAAVKLPVPAAKKMKRERSAGEVNLEVRVQTIVRFNIIGVKSKHYNMDADCAPVLVHFGSRPFQSVGCDVDI